MSVKEAAKKLLPFLEEALAPLLPVGFGLEEAEEEAHLYWEGQPLARLSLVGDGLSPDEIARWQPAVLALAQELLNRLAREKFLEGLPGLQILQRDLEAQDLTGLLISGVKPPVEGLYALGEGLYFLPEEVCKPRTFLVENWAAERDFLAVSVRFGLPEDVLRAQDLLWLARAFGFTWLSSKALKFFSEECALEDPFEELFSPLLRAFEAGAVLVLAEGEEGPLGVLQDQFRVFLPLNARRLLGAWPGKAEEAHALAEDLGLCAGIYAGGALLPPLAAVLAAFEHAKRLSEPQPVIFSPFTYHVAGDLYLDWGDLGAAYRCYIAGKEGTAQPIDLLNSLAVIMVQLGRRGEAREYLEEAIRRSPEDPLLHYNLGLFLKEEGAQGAEKAFEAAFRLAPKEAVFAEAYAECLASQGDWPGVEKVLSGVSLSPKGKFLLARAFYERGDLQESFALFKEVVRKEPRNALVLAYLALLFAQLEGELEVAESLASEAEKIDPQGVQTLVRSLREFLKEESH